MKMLQPHPYIVDLKAAFEDAKVRHEAGGSGEGSSHPI